MGDLYKKIWSAKKNVYKSDVYSEKKRKFVL